MDGHSLGPVFPLDVYFINPPLNELLNVSITLDFRNLISDFGYSCLSLLFGRLYILFAVVDGTWYNQFSLLISIQKNYSMTPSRQGLP